MPDRTSQILLGCISGIILASVPARASARASARAEARAEARAPVGVSARVSDRDSRALRSPRFLMFEQRVRHNLLWFGHSLPQPPDVSALDAARERNRVRPVPAPGSGTGLGSSFSGEATASLGALLFGGVAVLAAHAPRRVRAIFDEPVYLGPAVFGDGAMGVGLGGRFQ